MAKSLGTSFSFVASLHSLGKISGRRVAGVVYYNEAQVRAELAAQGREFREDGTLITSRSRPRFYKKQTPSNAMSARVGVLR